MPILRITQLEQLFARIIEKLQFEYGSEDANIAIDGDLYRSIPAAIWDDFSNQANGQDSEQVGSLEDDVAQLIKLSGDADQPCSFVDFDRMASVLLAISEQQNPSKTPKKNKFKV